MNKKQTDLNETPDLIFFPSQVGQLSFFRVATPDYLLTLNENKVVNGI